eukprot:6201114-Pleurochrysis_carterae.AAC.1
MLPAANTSAGVRFLAFEVADGMRVGRMASLSTRFVPERALDARVPRVGIAASGCGRNVRAALMLRHGRRCRGAGVARAISHSWMSKSQVVGRGSPAACPAIPAVFRLPTSLDTN